MTRDELIALERCVSQLTTAQDRIDRMLLQRKRLKPIAQPEPTAAVDPTDASCPDVPGEFGAILAESTRLRQQVDLTFATNPPLLCNPPADFYDDELDDDHLENP